MDIAVTLILSLALILVAIAIIQNGGIQITIKHDHTYNVPEPKNQPTPVVPDPTADAQRAIEDVANRLQAIFLDDSQIQKDEENK